MPVTSEAAASAPAKHLNTAEPVCADLELFKGPVCRIHKVHNYVLTCV